MLPKLSIHTIFTSKSYVY